MSIEFEIIGLAACFLFLVGVCVLVSEEYIDEQLAANNYKRSRYHEH